MSFRDKGEEIAAVYLKKKGYKILTSNFKGKGFEIDLVTKKGKIIGYACHCGYEYCQKKPILSRISKDSSQKITYNPTTLVEYN